MFLSSKAAASLKEPLVQADAEEDAYGDDDDERKVGVDAEKA